MNLEEVNSDYYSIYLSGDIYIAKYIIQKFCYTIGLCVTVENCDFIYTGGTEKGIKVGLLNYPRFPKKKKELYKTTLELAKYLRKKLYQDSVLIIGKNKTVWISRKK